MRKKIMSECSSKMKFREGLNQLHLSPFIKEERMIAG